MKLMCGVEVLLVVGLFGLCKKAYCYACRVFR